MNVLELKLCLKKMIEPNYSLTNSIIEKNLFFLLKHNYLNVLDNIPSESILGIKENELVDYLTKYNLEQVKTFLLHESTIKEDIESLNLTKNCKKIMYKAMGNSEAKLDILHSIHMNLMDKLSCSSIKCAIEPNENIKDDTYKIELLIFN